MSDARPPRLCPYCYAGTPAEATTCWLCQSALPAYEQRPTSAQADAVRIAGAAQAPQAAPRTQVEADFVVWAVATAIASVLLVVLLIDVGFLGGLGYALLVAVGAAPVLAALAAMLWLRRPRSASPHAPSVRGEPKDPTIVGSAIGTIALTVTAVLALSALVVLLVLALLVLAFVACLALVGTGGLH